MNDVANNTVTITSHNTSTLSDFAAKFGSSVEQVWGAALHQATIDGIFSLISIFFFAIALTVWTLILRKNTAPDGKWDDEVANTMLKLFTGVGWVMFGITVFTSLPMLYASFFNPDFWVLKQFTSVAH